MNKTKNKITKDTMLVEVMAQESGKEVLAKHKVPCLICPMAQYEIHDLTVGDVCKMYGVDLKKLLEDLNKINSSKK